MQSPTGVDESLSLEQISEYLSSFEYAYIGQKPQIQSAKAGFPPKTISEHGYQKHVERAYALAQQTEANALFYIEQGVFQHYKAEQASDDGTFQDLTTKQLPNFAIHCIELARLYEEAAKKLISGNYGLDDTALYQVFLSQPTLQQSYKSAYKTVYERLGDDARGWIEEFMAEADSDLEASYRSRHTQGGGRSDVGTATQQLCNGQPNRSADSKCTIL